MVAEWRIDTGKHRISHRLSKQVQVVLDLKNRRGALIRDGRVIDHYELEQAVILHYCWLFRTIQDSTYEKMTWNCSK